jgi:membrane-associated phospholipid phosphatase
MRRDGARRNDGPVSKLPTLLASPTGQFPSAGQLRRLEHRLPNGRRDLLRQVAIWLGFALGYQIARGLADRGPAEAFRNADRLIRLEERLGGLPELDLERHVLASGSALVHILNWTYWLAQFAAVGAALLWIYLRRNDGYTRLRNTIIVANTLGLVGYIAWPTAPPRLLPERGFVDTLGRSEALNHGSGIVQVLANPYAAMPSLHAADALIVGVALAAAYRSRWLKALFLLWPLWVCFSLLATANHYWLDIAAGAALAALGAALTARRSLARVPLGSSVNNSVGGSASRGRQASLFGSRRSTVAAELSVGWAASSKSNPAHPREIAAATVGMAAVVLGREMRR